MLGVLDFLNVAQHAIAAYLLDAFEKGVEAHLQANAHLHSGIGGVFYDDYDAYK